jgi:hypothetical protein
MRRITLWVTATLAVIALVIAYQLNAAGIGGKDGDDSGGRAPTTCATATSAPETCPPSAGGAAAPSASPSAVPSGNGGQDSDSGKPGGTDNGQTGKPGENKG